MTRVQVFGNGLAGVKIYPLRRKGTRYRSYPISWYELGERRTKTVADPLEARERAGLSQRRVETIRAHVQLFRKQAAVQLSGGR